VNDAECSECDSQLDIQQQKQISNDAIDEGISSVQQYKDFARKKYSGTRPKLRRRSSTGEMAAYGAVGYAAGVASTYVVGAAYLGRAVGLR